MVYVIPAKGLTRPGGPSPPVARNIEGVRTLESPVSVIPLISGNP